MTEMQKEDSPARPGVRQRANRIKSLVCKNVIAVVENPKNIANLGSIVRNVNALGAEKVYVVSRNPGLRDDWQQMREQRHLLNASASAIKWTFVRVFEDTQSCLDHLAYKGFVSLVTSPHVKGKENHELSDWDFTQFKRLAVWFGNESKGISDLAVENSAGCIQIPMAGIIESLNLGTASGIVLHEITRQRRAWKQRRQANNMSRSVVCL